MDEIGIWPRFGGRAMHDHWASYDAYIVSHSLCGAHLMRDCLYLAEQEQQARAAEMADHLLAMHHAAQEWRLPGAICIPRMERNEWLTHYARDLGKLLCGPTSSYRDRGEKISRAAEAERRQEIAR